MQRRPRNPGFGRQPAQAKEGDVSEALLRQARKSGQLNLSNRGLTKVPDKVWRVNVDVPPEARSVSLDCDEGDKWWEIVDLTKLILASNKLTEISPDIIQFPALAVLDVSICKMLYIVADVVPTLFSDIRLRGPSFKFFFSVHRNSPAGLL